MILEFYVKERALVEATYADLTGCGYRGYRAPYVAPFGMYVAMIEDPDGTLILRSAD